MNLAFALILFSLMSKSLISPKFSEKERTIFAKKLSKVFILSSLRKKSLFLSSRRAKISLSFLSSKAQSSFSSLLLLTSCRLKKVLMIRVFISFAALLVKVIAKISLIFAPLSTKATYRTLKAKVLPLPALASRAKKGLKFTANPFRR